MAKVDELPVLIKLGIAVAIIAILGALGYFMVLKTMEEANKTAEAALKQKQDDNKTLSGFESRLTELNRTIAALQVQLEIQKKIVPDEKDVPPFVHLLQTTATTAGIEIRSVVAKPVVRKEYYTEAPFDLELDGPYYAALNFMDRVSKLERIVNIEGLKMNGITGKAGGGKYAYDANESVTIGCTAKAFYSNNAAEAPAKPAAK